jgi:hypothetical protein
MIIINYFLDFNLKNVFTIMIQQVIDVIFNLFI